MTWLLRTLLPRTYRQVQCPHRLAQELPVLQQRLPHRVSRCLLCDAALANLPSLYRR